MAGRSMSPTAAVSLYVDLLMRLRELIDAGHGNGAEADEIRDRMDLPWRCLEARDVELIDRLAEDLNRIQVTRSSSPEVD